MTATSTSVKNVALFSRAEAVTLAATENERALDQLRSLSDADWSNPTDCSAWNVRALAGHVLGGMEGFASFREFVHQMRAGKKAAGDRPLIDGMTEVQVRERAGLSRDQLLARLADVGPRAARARGRIPDLLRRMPLKQDMPDGTKETWVMGYLLEVILTRDTWMHRIDISRATGRPLTLTSDHDGRIVADVVAEWGRRHGQPFLLHLEGPAGGEYASGTGGEEITIDAIEFCRILSGRATGAGLLTQEVPF
ncbi:MAG: maleylpyruvate isomerase family mycothiol-dependent enzyme [Acidimicrobiales bacterium]